MKFTVINCFNVGELHHHLFEIILPINTSRDQELNQLGSGSGAVGFPVTDPISCQNRQDEAPIQLFRQDVVKNKHGCRGWDSV